MPIWPHVAGDGGLVNFLRNEQATSGYFGPPSGLLTANYQARTNVEVRDRTGFDVNHGFILVTANSLDNASTLRFHDDGTDIGPTVTIPAATTGRFADSTSATIVSGSLICWHLTTGASSMSSENMDVSGIAFSLGHDSSENSLVMANGIDVLQNRNLTEFMNMGGSSGDAVATELEVEYILRVGATFDDSRVFVTTNDITSATHVIFRVDSVDTGLDITITASTTGEFESSTAVTVSTGSTINYSIVTGTSGMSNHDLVISVRSVHMDSTGHLVIAADTDPGTLTTNIRYWPLEGGTSDNNDNLFENNASIQFPFAFAVEDMFVRVTTAPNSESSIRVEQGNTNRLLTTLPASTTGAFEDNTPDTVVISTGDPADRVVLTRVINGGVSPVIVYVAFEVTQIPPPFEWPPQGIVRQLEVLAY